MTEKIDEIRQKVAGTNIDPRSLLSTDYFNTFNSVVMVLDMVADMPELMDEIEQWQYLDYCTHFSVSGLDFADLAIEAYAYAPQELRQALEQKSIIMKNMVENYGKALRQHLDAGEMDIFAGKAHSAAEQLRGMMEEGNGIVHGDASSTQTQIDTMFDDGAAAAAFGHSAAETGGAPASAPMKGLADQAFADIDKMFGSNSTPIETGFKKKNAEV